MIKRSRTLATIGLIALSLPLLAGCNDGKETKAMMEQALVKQADMSSYRFNGSAEFELPSSGTPSGNPLVAGLRGMLANSKLEWSGVASLNPVRLESELKLTPRGSSSTYELPMIIKDNKLFAHIPLLNAPDEYISWDKTPTENLSNSSAAALDFLRLFLADVEPGAFNQEKPNQLILSITKDNAAAVSEAWSKHRQEAAQILPKYGLVGAGQWGGPGTDGVSAMKLTAPGEIRLTLDESGFIREMTADLRWQSETTEQAAAHVRLQNRYDDINQNPPFAKDIPSKVKPFEQIGKFLTKP